MGAEFRSARLLIVINILGAATFLLLASKTWIEPELREEGLARSGDAAVWFSTALPVLILLLILDLAWLAQVVGQVSRRETWHAALPLGLVALQWLGATLLDLAMR